MNRRQFMKTSAAVGAGALLMRGRAYAFYQSSPIPLWQTAFRNAGAIPVALPDGTAATGAIHYTISIEPFTDNLGAGGLTTLWGFKPANALALGANPAHLGGIIVANKDEPVQITFQNNLPATHIIPTDLTIPGANQAQNRTAIHMHGAFVPWISDGGPFDWFAPDGTHGESFLNNAVLNPRAAPGQAEYYYPNAQSARLLWYHDHAWGITRINAYAGIATAYIIRDDFEAGLVATAGLPPYVETSVLGGTAVQELPIVVQDKIFVDAANIATVDPGWTNLPVPQTTGSLWYAHVYDTARYGKLGQAPAGPPPPNASCVPEYFGDTMLANGTVYPQVDVEPRRYRFRILNACNARFLNLQMYVDDGTPNGITLDNHGNPLNLPALNAAATNPQGKPTSNFLVIGSEGGFLPSAVWVPSNMPMNAAAITGSLIMGPAERSDVIFDFSKHAGQKLILYTDAPAPFPVGDPRNDYFPGFGVNKNPVNGTTPAGNGPNTRVIMRFNVLGVESGEDAALTIAKGTSFQAGIDPLLVTPGNTTIAPDPAKPGNVLVTKPDGTKVSAFLRSLTLNETFDVHGRLIQLEGTNIPLGNAKTGFGRAYLDSATEVISKDAIEVWQIANLTGDTHPIHFHLVNVQIISRQAFQVSNYNGVPNFRGAPVPPAPDEFGWKETVRMNPGEVITVIMKFSLPSGLPFTVPTTPRNAASPNQPGLGLSLPPGAVANEYVWHCHILEHEEHDMMRPLVVIS